MTRKEIIFILRNKGHSYQEIGELLRITKQRAHQLYEEYYQENVKETKKVCEICGSEKDISLYEDKVFVCPKCAKLLIKARRRKWVRGKEELT